MSCPNLTSIQNTITDAELNQVYSTGNIPGLLPSSLPGLSDRDSNKVLNKNAINNIIKSLKSSGVIPTRSHDSESFMKKQDELLKNIKAEYCFYESRYKYSLNKLFSAITNDNQNSLKSYLASTIDLNQKLNDLTQIINGVTEDMLSSKSDLEDKIKEFDKQNKEQQLKIQNQSKIITSNQASIELNKKMVKFTEQKAKYSNNLLGLYSFLNIVALGLLVYVYKSARD